MSEKVVDFADVLDVLCDNYDEMVVRFESYDTFKNTVETTEDATCLNLLRDASAHQWAKYTVDCSLRKLDFPGVKSRLISSFMNDPDGWICCDTNSVRSCTPCLKLDEVLAREMWSLKSFVNTNSYIRYAQGILPLNHFVNELVCELMEKGDPLLKIREDMHHSIDKVGCLFVSEELLSSDPSLLTMFRNACSMYGIWFQIAYSPEPITYFSCFGSLPLCYLQDLPRWEWYYEQTEQKMLHTNESNRGIYNEETGLPWKDYPALVYEQDPRIRRENGQLSKEGMFFISVIDPLFKKALKLGIIEEVQSHRNEYSYYYYYIDYCDGKCFVNGKYLDEVLRRDEKTGSYTTDSSLFAHAYKNPFIAGERYFTDLKKECIWLMEQGGYNAPNSNRAVALERAKRALRRNVPQFIAVKNMVTKVEAMLRSINERNEANG